jgi:hypothetical protein
MVLPFKTFKKKKWRLSLSLPHTKHTTAQKDKERVPVDASPVSLS